MTLSAWIEPIGELANLIEMYLDLPFPYATDYTNKQVLLASIILMLILGMFFQMARK